MRYCGCSVKNQVLEIAWLSLNRLSSSIFCYLSVSLLGTRNTQLNLHLFKYIQAYKPYFDPEEYLQVPTVITFWSIHWIFLWPIWWVTPSILRLVYLLHLVKKWITYQQKWRPVWRRWRWQKESKCSRQVCRISGLQETSEINCFHLYDLHLSSLQKIR